MQQVKTWSQECPENFAHLWHILEGEQALAKGNLEAAIQAYDEGAESADKTIFSITGPFAMSGWLSFWQQKGRHNYFLPLLTQAYKIYQEWGSSAKIQHLERSEVTPIDRSDRKEKSSVGLDTLTLIDLAKSISGNLRLKA